MTDRDPSHTAAPTSAAPTLSVVVPFYDEHENVEALHNRLASALGALGEPYEVVCVDDGSRDRTPELLDALHRADPRVVVVHLSRNFGHQAAVSAGIDHARGRAVVVLDGDLQDPPELIGALVGRWREGFEVVYAVRRSRKEPWYKRASYHAFYRLMGALSDLDLPMDSGDFCLMDRKVVDVLRHLPERLRFVRGLRSFVGFRQAGVAYDRDARLGGDPKYTFRKLSALAVDGLVSFSGRPLRLAVYMGLAAILTAFGLLVWVLHDAFMHGDRAQTPRGWASTVVIILFMSSIQLFSLGIIGEYIRIIFLETKGRPTYIVREASARDPEGPPS